MKRIFLMLLAAALLFFRSLPAKAEAGPELIRLHVVAQSDSAADQAAKLRVRDACLECARELLQGCPDADAAFEALARNRSCFASAARLALAQSGSAAPVRVQTGVFPFPDRIYGHTLVPAGDYRALRVVIGAGGGHNWWCVLYPGLCALDEGEYAAGDGEAPELYSAIWEWLRGLFCA